MFEQTINKLPTKKCQCVIIYQWRRLILTHTSSVHAFNCFESREGITAKCSTKNWGRIGNTTWIYTSLLLVVQVVNDPIPASLVILKRLQCAKLPVIFRTLMLLTIAKSKETTEQRGAKHIPKHALHVWMCWRHLEKWKPALNPKKLFIYSSGKTKKKSNLKRTYACRSTVGPPCMYTIKTPMESKTKPTSARATANTSLIVTCNCQKTGGG